MVTFEKSYNFSKTKEMIVVLRRIRSPISPLYINATEVERISTFKFLDTHISDYLNCNINCYQILKEALPSLEDIFVERLGKKINLMFKDSS